MTAPRPGDQVLITAVVESPGHDDAHVFVRIGRTPVQVPAITIRTAADHDANRQVEAVLDILAPIPDVGPEYLAVLGLTAGVRVPAIRFDFEGRAVMPSDEQIRALAEQIVTAVRTATGPAPDVDPDRGMHQHDGLAPHSHEVRADHRGVGGAREADRLADRYAAMDRGARAKAARLAAKYQPPADPS